MTEKETADFDIWLKALIDNGGNPDILLNELTRAGWERETAIGEIVSSYKRVFDILLVIDPIPLGSLPTQMPGENLFDRHWNKRIEGQDITVALMVKDPQIVVFDNLLSNAECEEIISLSRPRLERSTTITDAGGSALDERRTSEGAFVKKSESPVIATIEKRIATLVGWPEDRGEDLQILRYAPGAEYQPHYDYFDESKPGAPSLLARGGQRLATLVMYLNTPAAGGATVFPDVGIEVAPKKGSGVFFSYARPHPSSKSLHGGMPVIEGEKWVATKWLRLAKFT